MQKNLILFVGIMCLALGVYSLIVAPENSIIPLTTNAPSSTGNSTNTEVVYGGTEEGRFLGKLIPNQSATITYVSGKIISNTKNNYSTPIWGIPINQTDANWIPLMPYAKEGMWTNAIFVDTGDGRTAFKQGQNEIVVKNYTSHEQNLYLRFHEAKGYYADNTGDVRFRVAFSNSPTTHNPLDISADYGIVKETPFHKKKLIAFSTPAEFFNYSGKTSWEGLIFDRMEQLPSGLHFVDGRPLTKADYRRAMGGK